MREWIDELEKRTSDFAFDVTNLATRLERVPGLRNACNQMIDSSNSVASNHLAMRRGRSDREFAAKLQIVNEEIVETVGWLEMVDRFKPRDEGVKILLRESRELRAIFAASKRTTRQRLDGPPDEE